MMDIRRCCLALTLRLTHFGKDLIEAIIIQIILEYHFC